MQIREGIRVLQADGELDAASSLVLEDAIEACPNGLRTVVDVRGVTFIESTGLHTLLKERRLGRPAGLVRTPGSSVDRLLAIVDAEKTMALYDDLKEAAAALGRPAE